MTLNDNSSESQYVCPSCEQPAESDTIVCEECEEWFHFECIGLNNQSADLIQPDVPFICLFCNDNLLYVPKPEEQTEKSNNSENKSDSKTETSDPNISRNSINPYKQTTSHKKKNS